MIYVLTYSAPHKKTQDLLFRLKIRGYDNVLVLATPWQKRKNFIPLIPHRNFNTLNVSPANLCNRLDYKFLEIESGDLSSFFKANQRGIILIGGAGILPMDVVSSGDIINSHPAYLPHVRGLDSLKWAIYYGKPIGVTTHVISEECDAGKLIKQQLVPLYLWDTFHSVAYRQYEMEIDMLVDSIEDIKIASLEELSTTVSDPMRRMSHRIEADLLQRFQDLINGLGA